MRFVGMRPWVAGSSVTDVIRDVDSARVDLMRNYQAETISIDIESARVSLEMRAVTDDGPPRLRFELTGVRDFVTVDDGSGSDATFGSGGGFFQAVDIEAGRETETLWMTFQFTGFDFSCEFACLDFSPLSD